MRYYRAVSFDIKIMLLITITNAFSTIGIATTTTTTTAFASSQDDPKNGWGQAAKDTINAFGGQEFGEHTSNPDPSDEDRDTPRIGVGNLAEELTRQKNPDQLGEAVSGSPL
jgi:hypothetical protein